MKLALRTAAAFMLPLFALGAAHADEALAKAKGCTACHAVDKKMVGPAYNAIVACYQTKDAKKLAENKTTVAKHIKAGGSGVFGMVPMPAHPQLTDAELNKLVDWIFSIKPGECPKEFKPKS
ncbi:MAG: c-type cytochrome [Casimicrobiaceae bacterium]|nr:c-type cytochrome [Casimicrobiaceae bacterium]